MAANKAKAQEYRNAARHQLMELKRTGKSQTSAGFQKGWGAYGDRPTSGGASVMPGRFDVDYGSGVSDAEVDAFIAMMGGNPYDGPTARQQQAGREASVAATAAIGEKRLSDKKLAESSPLAIFREVMGDYEKKYGEARAANEKWFKEKIDRGEALGVRRQERAKNAGIAEKADIDDRLKAELANTRAYLAANGTDGSSMEGALALRTAANTAREQQRVSEMVDARANQYDYEDTNNLIQTIERRYDEYPDRGEALMLADRLGQAEALRSAREAREQGGGYQAAQYAPQVPYLSAPSYGGQGIGAPIYANIFGGQPQYVPQQQYPQAMSFDQYYDDAPEPPNQAMLDRLARQDAAKQARIQKRIGFNPRAMADNWQALMQ